MSLFSSKNNKDIKDKSDLEFIRELFGSYIKDIDKIKDNTGVCVIQCRDIIKKDLKNIETKLDTLLTRDDLKCALEQISNKQNNIEPEPLEEIVEDTTTEQSITDESGRVYRSFKGKLLQVVNFDKKTIGVYTNATKAAERTGFSPSTITKCVKELKKLKPNAIISRSPKGGNELFVMRLIDLKSKEEETKDENKN